MADRLRLNLLRPRPLVRPRSAAGNLLAAVFAALAIGAAFGFGVRWLVGAQLQALTAGTWQAAGHSDLGLIAEPRRPPLAGILGLSDELHRLRRGRTWYDAASGPLAAVLGSGADAAGLVARSQQLEVALRGELEAMNARLEEIVELPPAERDATLRILAFGRWRLHDGEYAEAMRYYEARRAEIASRPTATATASPSPTPTVSPTPTARRGKAVRQRGR